MMVGAKVQLYLLVALAFVAGVFGVYMSGVQRGIARQQAKIDANRLDNYKTAKEAADEVEAMDDPRLSDLARRWVRKDQ
jgi:hypothetical protein